MVELLSKRELLSKSKSPCPAITITHCSYERLKEVWWVWVKERQWCSNYERAGDVVRFGSKSLQASIEDGPYLQAIESH